MTLFWFNHYGLTTNKCSSSRIVRTLSKRNHFSIVHCAKFVGYVQCPTVILHPEYMNIYIHGYIYIYIYIYKYIYIYIYIYICIINNINNIIF